MESNPNRAVGQEEMERARDKLYAKIFPNTPTTPDQRDAFERAVTYQAEADAYANDAFEGLPRQVTSFHTGNFSATMEARTGLEMCPEAYGILLRAGLMYKGLPAENEPPRRVSIGYVTSYEQPEQAGLSPVHPGVQIRMGDTWKDV